jgi:chromosome segregation ATPase
VLRFTRLIPKLTHIKVQAEKNSHDNELPRLKARLQEMLDQLSSSQGDNSQLRSQLLNLGDEAGKTKARVCEMEKERSTLQDQLSQRNQEFDVSSQESSALLMRKDETIKSLEADLYRSDGDLKAALEKACDLQERLDVRSVDMQELQAELHRLREDIERKDAANEGLDDRRFDAEVALANDRRAFAIAQNELLERSLAAEAQSRHKENLLTEALAQMAKDREEYRLTILATPEADFRLLRVVSY